MNESKYRQRGPYRLHNLPGVQVDNYGANPLADYARSTDTERATKVSGVAEPPKMFSGGTADLPPFTASGLPPEELLKLPFGVRHAVAAESDITKVYDYFETYSLQPDAVIQHEGLENAYHRVQQWLENTDTRTEAEKLQEDVEHELLMSQWGLREGQHVNPFTGEVQAKAQHQGSRDPSAYDYRSSSPGTATSSSIQRTGSPLLGGAS